jgi:hypothetical protein
VRNVLLGAAGVFSLLTLLARLAERWWPESTTANGLAFFDAVREATVPTFFSALLLLACAGLAAAMAPVTGRRRWRLLAGALGLLALDEAVALHEATIGPLRDALDAGGVFYFTWVIPGAALLAGAIVVFRSLLADLSPSERRLAVAATALFFTGALGFELAEGFVVDRYGQRALANIPLQTVEEALEMVGATLFLYALLERLEPWVATLRVGRVGGAS